jgi:arylsulfatase A-like enzyme
VGIAANRAFLDSRWGLGRGFDLWLCEQLESVPGQGYLQANRVVALSQQFMAERGDGKTLLFLNFMEAHTPWIPREGYVEDPSVIDIMHLPTGLEWAGDRHRFAPITTQVNNGKRDATRAERASWEAAYASELRYLDDQLGELFEVLKDNGHDFEKDYTIILSDHGEFLGEHRLVEHSKALYKQVSDVPLIVRGPGISPGVDPEPVQTSDVPNLLLGWMGMAPLTGTPETELQISEMYWARRKNRSSAAQTLRFDHLQRSFTLGNHRLVLQDDGQHMAFDLAADPGEYDNLYGKAQWVPEMERLGQAWLVGQSYGEQVEVGAMSQAQEDALRALGYVE